MRKIIIILLLIITALSTGVVLYGTKTIHDLLGENSQLKDAISNLSHEDQIGYAKVIKQETAADGSVKTTLKFVETDRNDKTRTILEKEFTIDGDIVHFDVLIVSFTNELVKDGRARSLYLWRRIYGETMSPASGLAIEDEGMEPERYSGLLKDLWESEQSLFWSSIWKLANDPDYLKDHSVKAIYGNVVYKKLRTGLIYVFKISNTGHVYPETVPDM